MNYRKPLAGTELDTLRRVIERWKQGFTGSSALELARVFGVPHEEAIRTLEILANTDEIYLRRARLGQPIRFREVRMDGDVTLEVPEAWKMVDTLVAFPRRHVLERIFAEEGKDYGVFANRLHRGDSQMQHYYFKLEVLDDYLKHPDRYCIWDDMVGGTILTNDNYYSSLSQDERDVETFAQVRYGKRRLKDGSVAVAAIAKDLSDLPCKKQLMWASFEIDNPQFAEKDAEFEKYWRESFEASFLDHEDPLQYIYETVRNINNLIQTKLFRNDSANPWLQYPVVNTNWAYQNAHKELFKLFGPDSLDEDVLLELLRNRFGVGEGKLKGNERRYKGKWALFKMLVEETPAASFEPLKRCCDARVRDAHEISAAFLPRTNLTQKFQGDCLGILETLKRLELHLRNILA